MRRSGYPEKVKYLRFGSSPKNMLQSHIYSGRSEGFVAAPLVVEMSRWKRYTFSEGACSTIALLFDQMAR